MIGSPPALHRSIRAPGAGVWRVALVSLAGAAAVAVLGLYRLGQLEEVALRQQADATRLDTATHALVEIQELMDNLTLAGAARNARAVEGLEERLARVARELGRIRSLEDSDGIREPVHRWATEGNALAARLLANTQRRAGLAAALNVVWQRLRTELIGRRRDSASWHGEAQLHLLRWLRNLEQSGASESVDELAEAVRSGSFASSPVFEQLEAELHELEVGLDRMRWGRHAGEVDDLRLNRIAPTLERLRQLVGVLGREVGGSAGVGRDWDALEAMVDEFCTTVRGLAEEQLEDGRLQAEVHGWRGDGDRLVWMLDVASREALRDRLKTWQRASRDSLFLVLGLLGLAAAVTVWQARRGAHRVDRRVGELTAERDDAARSAAEASSFLTNMSHEVRTPMNGVLSMAQLLAETELNERQRQMVRTIEGSSEALLVILNDVLDHSRLESHRMVFKSQPLSLCEVAADAMRVTAEEARRKGIELLFEVDDGLAAMHLGDGGRIRQVLLNLVGNAVKFSEHGYVRLRIGVAGPPARIDSRQAVRIEVEDSGVGIPPEQQGRIFQPFQQGDGSVTRVHGGAGLGLTIARELAEGMGGSLALAASSLRGSRFELRLALVVQQLPQPLPELEQLSRSRVLLVGGSEEFRASVGAALRSGVAEVVEVADSERLAAVLAGEALRGGRFDGLVLLGRVQACAACDRLKGAGLRGIVRVCAVGERDVECPGTAGQRPLLLTPPVAVGGLLRALLESFEAREPAAAATGPQGHVSMPTQPAGLRVLVVEDHPVNRKVAERILLRFGCEVAFAEDGAEGAGRAERERFDLILMDLQMPVCSGFEACERIRAGAGPNVDTPILALTASILAEDRERCVQVGMQDVLIKPIRLADLREALDRWGHRRILLPAPS